ncbi:MAG: hypothetical protein JNJ53_03495 [Rhizobiales bacterium]|nr:hypothetical protein [Hyphomicrobiales bacterium]
MQAIVTKSYRRPYQNPISVAAGTPVVPDFEKYSEVPGWVWCSAEDTRAGWVPRAYLAGSGCNWRVTRDYDAIELSVEPGERLTIETEESGFYLAIAADGSRGWVPRDHVSLLTENKV